MCNRNEGGSNEYEKSPTDTFVFVIVYRPLHHRREDHHGRVADRPFVRFEPLHGKVSAF